MKSRIIAIVACIVSSAVPLHSAPVGAAEVDLLFRMKTPAAEIAREIQKRGLSEELSVALKAKFAAGGVSADTLARMPRVAAVVVPKAPVAVAAPASAVQSPAVKVKWPKVGEQYPPLMLSDPDGRPVNLAQFRGKVLLIEPIGIPCAACQAFAGGDVVGEFKAPGSQGVQPDIGTIESLFARFAPGVRFDDDRIVYVQLLLYGTNSAAPTLDQARKWRAHFAPALKTKQPVIMVGTPEMISPEAYALIPGFHLVDQNFVLRYDGAGHTPPHSIFKELLPAIPAMLAR